MLRHVTGHKLANDGHDNPTSNAEDASAIARIRIPLGGAE
jgi:hypothetical protein